MLQDIDLQNLRERIDNIDEELLNLLAKRFDTTQAIGVLKSESGISSKSSDRELKQFKKFEILGKERNLSINLVEGIFRLVIDEVVRNHDSIKQHG